MQSTIYVTNPSYRFSCNHEQGLSWAQAHDSTYATGGCGTDTAWRASVYKGGSNSFDIYRMTALFDTSSIPSNATISSVVFNAYEKQVHDGDGSNSIIYLCPVNATGNAVGYYNQSYFGASLAELNLQDQENDNLNTWWRPSIATNSIVKGGTTILGLRHYQDYWNAEPWNNCTGVIAFAGVDDATYKPYLVITWTTPAAVTTGSATSIAADSATLAGNVTDAGGGTISERGVCWGLSANPTTANSKASAAGTTGAFTVPATGLAGSSVYHFRSYVITENSTQYGADQTFTTLPIVTTAAMTNVGVGSATANGQVTSAGAEITERGFVWGLATAPTISDNKSLVTGTTGIYSKMITALPVGRKIYLRAFATNTTGTVYGSEVNFIMFGGAAIFSSL